jgi:serine/threonine protein phosphatase 1
MKSAPRRPPSLPDGLRIYALSDIHGCADLLERAFASIDADIQRKKAGRLLHVFLGDYIDRGLDSRRTLDLLIERARHNDIVFLKGNHEDVLLDFLRDPTRLHDWRQFGGLQTLISYGIRPSLNPGIGEQVDLARAFTAALPPDHRRFLEDLKPSFSCGDFFFAHAGVRPGVDLGAQQEEDLLWIREEFLNSPLDFGKFIVHGHTPVKEPDLRPNRLNIDTGAYATGQLTLLRIEGAELKFLDV